MKTGEAKAVKKKVAGRGCSSAFQSAKALHSPAAVARLAALPQSPSVVQLAAELRRPEKHAGSAASRPHQTEDKRQQQS